MTEENTQVEQVSEVSLRDELKNAIEGAQESKESVEESVEEVVEEATEEVAEEVTQADEPEEEVDEIEQQVDAELPLVPKDWSADEKEAFQALLDSDDEDKRVAAEVLIERYNGLKKGFYSKTQEYAKATKELKEINQVFQPFDAALQQSGVPKSAYIQNMITWEKALHERPVDAVKELMAKFGVKAEQIAPQSEYGDYENDFTSEPDSAIMQKIERLEAANRRLETQLTNQPVQTQIEQFKAATDSEGKLMHPYFDEVAPIMSGYLQTGKAKDLSDAYRLATGAIYEEPSQAVDLNKIRQKVAQAKKAGKAIKTSGTRPDYSRMSIRDELAAKLK